MEFTNNLPKGQLQIMKEFYQEYLDSDIALTTMTERDFRKFTWRIIDCTMKQCERRIKSSDNYNQSHKTTERLYVDKS